MKYLIHILDKTDGSVKQMLVSQSLYDRIFDKPKNKSINKDLITDNFTLSNLPKVLGKTLIDVEHNYGESSDCAEEVILHFGDGSEILVFQHPDGTIHIEGD